MNHLFSSCLSLQVAMGSLMSSYRISDRFTEYVVAVAFMNPCLGPLLNAIFLAKYREGYLDLAQMAFSLISRIKGKLKDTACSISC